MLKGGQRQMRYRLKKHYFDNVPANEVCTTSPVSCMSGEEWQNLVQMWSSSTKHKDTSEKNKLNRGKVQFQQGTGSRSYIAHCHVIKENYKAEELAAIDLFKECHNSKKTGFTEPVKKAIADMQAIMDQPVPDGQEPKSSNTAVFEVLKYVPTTKFLQNVGHQSASKNSSRGGVASRVQELEAELQTKNQVAEELREQLSSQKQELDALKKRAEEAEAASNKHLGETEFLKKKTEDNEAILLRLLRLQQGQINPSP